MNVGVTLGNCVGVDVGIGVLVRVLVGSGVYVGVDVGRAVCVFVGVAVMEGVGVDRASMVARTTASIVALAFGVALGVAVGKEARTMAWTVASIFGVAVDVTAGFVACAQPARTIVRSTVTILARYIPTIQELSCQFTANITITP